MKGSFSRGKSPGQFPNLSRDAKSFLSTELIFEKMTSVPQKQATFIHTKEGYKNIISAVSEHLAGPNRNGKEKPSCNRLVMCFLGYSPPSPSSLVMDHVSTRCAPTSYKLGYNSTYRGYDPSYRFIFRPFIGVSSRHL